MLNKVLKSHKKTTSANIKTDVKQQEIKKLIIALSYKFSQTGTFSKVETP